MLLNGLTEGSSPSSHCCTTGAVAALGADLVLPGAGQTVCSAPSSSQARCATGIGFLQQLSLKQFTARPTAIPSVPVDSGTVEPSTDRLPLQLASSRRTLIIAGRPDEGAKSSYIAHEITDSG
jgi:hypothetical protein